MGLSDRLLSGKHFLHYVINNGQFLGDLISEYEDYFNQDIFEAKKHDHRVTLPTSLRLYNNKNINDVYPLSIKHRNTNHVMHLSPQRSQCLHYLMIGNSAKEIAQLMNLSPRTVQFYLGLLREELGCKSSKELIIHYYDQVCAKPEMLV